MARRVAVQFVAELAAFRRNMRGGADEVRKVKAEAVAAQREVAGLGKAGEQAGRQLADGLVRGADGRLRDSKGRFAKAGTLAGEGFGDGFEQGSRRGLMRVAGLLGGGLMKAGGSMPAAGLAAIPATAGAAAVALQGIPPLLAAIGGGLGAIPGMAAGAAGAIGTVKVATLGMGDAIEEAFADDRDPYLQLSRNGQRFVASLTAQRQALLGLRNLAQDRVFAGLDAELTNLSATLLPFARTQVTRFGDTWNTTFREVAALGRSRQLLSGLDAALANADGFFDRVNQRIEPTGRSLGSIFRSSIPAVNAWGDGMLGYVDQFNAWVERSASSGRLDQFFEDAAEQADALLDVGREIFTLVGRIGGMQSGSTLLRDMADALTRFNAEATAMQSVEGVIRTGNAAIQGVVDVLVVLGEALGDTLADPGTAAAVSLFFDVLRAGAQIVGGLAQAFGVLPDDIQAVVLAGAALALLGGRLAGAMGRARDAVSGLTDRLRESGPAGVRAADGLDKTEKAARRAGIALIGLQVGSAVLGSNLRPQLNGLAHDMDAFARTGEVAGEAARLFGDDMSKLDQALKDIADTGAWSSFVRGTTGMVEGLTGLGDAYDLSLTRSRERIESLDAALTNMIASGGMSQAQSAFDRIAESAAKQGISTSELMKVLPGYAAAMQQAKTAGDGQAQATAAAEQRTRLLTGSMQSAITTMGSYTRAWQVLNGAVLSSDEAQLAAMDALDQVKAAFKSNTDTVTGNSRAAVENRIAVGQFAQAAADAAQKKYEETGSIEQANAVYQSHITALRGVLSQTSLTDAEINTLIASYAQLPAAKKTPVSAPGATTAKRQAEDFGTILYRLPNGKVIEIGVSGVESAIARVNRLQAEVNALSGTHIRVGGGGRGGHLEQRWGGLHEGGWTKAAVGVLREAAVYSARSPGRYFIAEPETGGEAFIPKNGNRERSISIGRRAMEWYGMTVVPKSVISGRPSGAVSTTTSRGSVAPAVDPAQIGAAVRAALIGMNVVMDGRAVGSVQGRQADLIARS